MCDTAIVTAEFKRAGDAAYVAGDGSQAAVNYTKALLALASDGLIPALLQNTVIAYLRLGEPAHALMHAAVVPAFFPALCAAHPKPYFLAAKAAVALGDMEGARPFLTHAPTGPTSKEPAVRTLAAMLGVTVGAGCSNSGLGQEYPSQHRAVARALVFASLLLRDTLPGCSRFEAVSGPPTSTAADAYTTPVESTTGRAGWLGPDPSSATTSVDQIEADLQQAAHLKAAGNTLFQAGDLRGALAKWAAALAAVRVLPHIVHQKAMAFLRCDGGALPHTCTLAVTALLFVPDSMYLLMTRSAHASAYAGGDNAFEQTAVALMCAEQALRMRPGQEEFLVQHSRFAATMRELCAHSALAQKASDGAVRTRHRIEMQGAGDGKAQVVAKEMMLAVLEEAEGTEKATPRRSFKAAHAHIGPPPESFEKTFFKTCLLPPGCSATDCFDHLAIGAKDAVMSWFMLSEAVISAGSAASASGGGGTSARRADDPDNTGTEGPPAWAPDPLGGSKNPWVAPGHFTIRLGGTLRDRQFWWQHAASGSVLFEPKHSYHAKVDHLYSFSNVQQFPLPLWLRDDAGEKVCAPGSGSGTVCSDLQPSAGGRKEHVHLAVGAIDLGEVAETLAHSQGTTTLGAAKPMLRWACWPGTAHACARMLVVIRMLQYKAPTDAIVQVWYSAAWAERTVPHFRTAVVKLLKSRKALKYGDNVRAWLERWRDAKVPLKLARREWLKRQVDSCCFIGNAAHERDRHALCMYRLTGQILDATTGSVPMFALVEEDGAWSNYACHESLLNTVTPEALLAEYGKLADGGDERTMVAAAVEVARRRVQALQSALSAQVLTIEVHDEDLRLGLQRLHASMRALRPDTMSWGNRVCEHMQPQAFHHLALSASLPHTRHFVHAMNWPRDVSGAYVLDLLQTPRSPAAVVRRRREVTAQGYAQAREAVRRAGAQSVVRDVPLENLMNIADSFLEQELWGAWVEAFAGMAPVGRVAVTEVLREPAYWIFSQRSSTVHFEMRYA